MGSFQWAVPTKIYFGRDIFAEAIKQESMLLKGSVMIVTTGGALEKRGLVQKLAETLEAMPEVKDVVIFDRVSPNPKLSEIREGVAAGKEKNVNALIGFGGGSAIDAAKAIAVCMCPDEDLELLFYEGHEPKNSFPVIAIPTTAGTGSELSKGAILTDEIRKTKDGIRGAVLYPKAAIVDPRFTDSVPAHITADTGFDVLAHAMESYVSRKSNAFSRALSEQAVAIVGEYLPGLMKNLSDKAARDKMSYASMIMGMNLGNVGTCLPHRLQYPVGAHNGSSHGSGLAALYHSWIFYEYDYSSEALRKLAYLLSGTECHSRQDVLDVFDGFMESIGLKDTLKLLGTEERQIEAFSKEVKGNMANDPAAAEEDIINKIYRAAYSR